MLHDNVAVVQHFDWDNEIGSKKTVSLTDNELHVGWQDILDLNYENIPNVTHVIEGQVQQLILLLLLNMAHLFVGEHNTDIYVIA